METFRAVLQLGNVTAEANFMKDQTRRLFRETLKDSSYALLLRLIIVHNETRTRLSIQDLEDGMAAAIEWGMPDIYNLLEGYYRERLHYKYLDN